MIVYVAGSSAEWERAQRVMEWIDSERWILAHDWVSDVIRERVIGGRADAELSRVEQRKYATTDLEALEGVDYLWFLAPEKPTAGAWVELGYAYAKNITIIASGSRCTTQMWCSLAQYCYDTDQRAMVALVHQLER